MSKFDELDHRLGHHDGKPNPTCAICLGEPSAFTAAPIGPWDYADLGAPAFPDWGMVWNHYDELVTFVSPKGEGPGGFWARIKPVKRLSPKESILNQIEDRPEVQLELGSGKWHPRVKILQMKNVIPDEAGLASPLGVDLLTWAEDQNYAKLLVQLERQRMFPISDVTVQRRTLSPTNTTEIASNVRCIPLQPFEAFLSD